MAEPTRWTGVRRVVGGIVKVGLLIVGVYLVIGFVATRAVPDPVSLSSAPAGSIREDPRPPVAHPAGTVLRGAISVHTGRSHDAEGTLDEVAEAAAAAGLDFVVLGDHVGDWAEGGVSLLEPTRIQGVLLVPGVELAVQDAGRVLAVGLDTLPREWLGTVDELIAEVGEEKGFLSIVHPRSPRARERWNGLAESGIDAWESFDVSEMARMRQDEALVGYRIAGLLATMATGRGHRSLARFWKEGTRTPALLAYDSARAESPVVLTGGLNHHPKARILGHLVPAYAPFFRTVVNHVRVPMPLDPDPRRARAQLLEALRSGRLFVTLEEAEGVQDFDFWARDGHGGEVTMGGTGPGGGSAALGIQVPGSGGRVLVRVLRNGSDVAWLEGRGGEVLAWPAPQPGSYRVELFRPGRKVGGLRFGFRPWIVSNPLELTTGSAEAAAVGKTNRPTGDPGIAEG